MPYKPYALGVTGLAGLQCTGRACELLKSEEGADKVCRALRKIADELGVSSEMQPKPDKNGHLYFIGPSKDDLPAALERAFPDWREEGLFEIPQ